MRTPVASALALATLLAACATPTPMPRDITDVLDGARISLVKGQELHVKLDGNRSTGFLWSLSRPAAPVLEQVGEPTYASRAAGGGLPGSGGETVFHFRGAQKGSTLLVFSYRRPWEANIPPARSVRFDIKVE